MSDENRIEIRDERHECFCQSKWFRKFLLITAGSFTGVFLALSLFAALHKPPMPAPCPYAMMRPAMHHHFYKFDRGHRGEFHRKMVKDFERKAPVRTETEADD